MTSALEAAAAAVLEAAIGALRGAECDRGKGMLQATALRFSTGSNPGGLELVCAGQGQGAGSSTAAPSNWVEMSATSMHESSLQHEQSQERA